MQLIEAPSNRFMSSGLPVKVSNRAIKEFLLAWVQIACLASAWAAEPTRTNAPPVRLFVLPSVAEMHRAAKVSKTNVVAAPLSKPSTTNVLEDLSLDIAQRGEAEAELEAKQFESMNGRPVLDRRTLPAKPWQSVLRAVSGSGGGLLSRNPNARRNPLEVDGW